MMTLQNLYDSIHLQVSQLTIDDYYIDPTFQSFTSSIKKDFSKGDDFSFSDFLKEFYSAKMDDEDFKKLRFLYAILLKELIYRYEEILTEETGKIIGPRSINNPFAPYPETIQRNTGEILHKIVEIKSAEFGETVKHYELSFEKKNIIDKDWRKQIARALTLPIHKIAGEFGKSHRNEYFKNIVTEPSINELSFMATLLHALKNNKAVEMTGKQILLPMSAGISAVIAIRKKGEVVKEKLGDNKMIFLKCEDKREVDHQVYSGVYISGPQGFYISIEKEIIEIEFVSTPIFSQLGNEDKISSILVSNRRAAEEEEQRKQDFFDDDDDGKRDFYF